MTNPFSAPKAEIPTVKLQVEKQSSSPLGTLASVASIIAIVLFFIIAVMLIPQSLRLASENDGLPARFQSGNVAAIRASWIGGLAAIGGILANVVGLVLVRARRAGFSLTILAMSILCMIAIAIAFKPS